MGFLLLLIGLGVLGFGFFTHLKAKRILDAPFKKTGDLASDPSSPDPKGAMSTEGDIVPPAEALLSPCTKQPCLAYEVEIKRLWEKTESTEDGTKTVKGSDTLTTLKGGAVFGLNDGSGVIEVDVSKGADFDNLKKGYDKELNGRNWASHVQFGELTYDVPSLDTEKYTIGFRAIEKYVPAEGRLFVLGKLEGSRLVKPGWRSMMASSKGREGLVGNLAKRKKLAFIGGGVAAALAIPLMLFGPSLPSGGGGGGGFCSSTLNDAQARCGDRVSSKSGETFTWNVTKEGEYAITVFAPKKKVAFAPGIKVTSATGEVVATAAAGVGQDAKVQAKVAPGTYTINVHPADNYMVKSGFSFDMEIVGPPEAPAPGAAPVAAAGAGKPAGEASLATALNELCPDTFCEGEYQFDFTSVDCPTQTACTVKFNAKHRASGRQYSAQLQLKGFTKASLEDEAFFAALQTQLAAWEDRPTGLAAAPKKKK